uniref:Tyrosine-protein phosphatase domain-containing protein n=2 Tax=Parascaris univalens TaxID=6257 RepID=A0A915BNT7_PARUN
SSGGRYLEMLAYFDISEQEKVSMQKNVIAEDVDDFIGRMTSMGKSQMMADHDNMHRKQRHIFSFTENLMKNRYKNIVLFDEGAVILSTGKRDKSSDTYIHATNIKTKFGNYVLAQSPKPETLNDWYRMIWQLNIAVIVCLIPLSTKEDCAKYFERKVGKKLKHKRFTIRTMTTRREEDCNIYELKFSNKDFKEDDRMIHLINFTKWKIIVRPPEPRKFLAMMRSVWATEASANSVGDDKTSSPTLVHGVTGTRRTGTYVIMSMLCRQMSEHHQISLLKVCSRVRHFRYSVMRNRICFTVLLESVLVFAADQGLVDRSNVDFQNAIKNIRNAVTIEEQ